MGNKKFPPPPKGLRAVDWARDILAFGETNEKDFAFHTLVKEKVPVEQIVALLEEFETFSRGVLEKIATLLAGSESEVRLNSYLKEIAETLILEEEPNKRDRGRHILMTIASSEQEWLITAHRFSVLELNDLRQKVLERFLQTCPYERAIHGLGGKVVQDCMNRIQQCPRDSPHQEVTRMHWVLMILKKMKKGEVIPTFYKVLNDRFGERNIPRSIMYRNL